MEKFRLVSILLLFLSLGLIFWSIGDPVCINSSTVKKLVIESKEGTYTIPNCGFRSEPVELPRSLVTQYKKLVRDIDDFEVIKDQIDPQYNPTTTIQTRLQNPQIHQWSGDILEIGQDYFEDRLQNRRHLIEVWLKNYLPLELKDHRVLNEILVDVYSVIIWGNPQVKDILSHQISDYGSVRWLDDIYTEASICSSPWRPRDRALFCEEFMNTRNANSKLLNELTLWSLRPLVVKTFYSFYSKLGLTKKMNYIKNLHLNVFNNAHLFQRFPILTDLSEITNLYKLTLEQLFQIKQFQATTPNLKIDLLVDVKKPTFNLGQFYDLEEAIRNKNLNVILRHENEFYVLPGFKPLQIGYAQVKSNKMIIVSCEPPQIDQIAKLKISSDRLLNVMDCTSVGSLKLSNYLTFGIEKYAERSTNNFVLYHIPSIQLAAKYWGMNKESFEKQAKGYQQNIKQALFGWGQIQSGRTIHVESALPIVEWVRWKSLTKTQDQ